jgi:hypothetical protein
LETSLTQTDLKKGRIIMKKYLGLLLFIVSSTYVFAQMSEEDVRARLELVHNGKIDQVRSEITSLRNQYPDDPGVLYLDAYVTEEGAQAVKKYQSLVDNFPKSVWADDALYKVYQYYYSIGLYKTADHTMERLNREYPTSIYAKKESSSSEKAVVTPVEIAPHENVETPFKQDSAASPSVSSNQSTVTSTPWVVQVGVYSQEANAVRQSNIYTQTIGRQAIVFQKQSGGKTMYAVGFDGFTDEKDARLFGADLKAKHNIDWFLVKR